jgi:photosystem II stability/assembly factor-like uncharacterized protein
VGTSAAAAPKPPKTVTAHRITRQAGTLKPGATVSSSSLGPRTFINNDVGFALAATTGAQYPAGTTDGGKHWKTIGPALHVNAAQAPLAVENLGATNTKTVFAYGGGQSVDVTSDGGKTWWRAFLGDDVPAVVAGNGHRLVAFAQALNGPSGVKAVTWEYITKDGGHHWSFSTAIGGG